MRKFVCPLPFVGEDAQWFQSLFAKLWELSKVDWRASYTNPDGSDLDDHVPNVPPEPLSDADPITRIVYEILGNIEILGAVPGFALLANPAGLQIESADVGNVECAAALIHAALRHFDTQGVEYPPIGFEFHEVGPELSPCDPMNDCYGSGAVVCTSEDVRWIRLTNVLARALGEAAAGGAFCALCESTIAGNAPAYPLGEDLFCSVACRNEATGHNPGPASPRRVQVGTVSVDSGQLLLTDPCYLHWWGKTVYRDLSSGRVYVAGHHFQSLDDAVDDNGQIVAAAVAPQGLPRLRELLERGTLERAVPKGGPSYDLDGCGNVTTKETVGGLTGPFGGSQMGIAIATGGDGGLPVFAELDDHGKVVRIVVSLARPMPLPPPY